MDITKNRYRIINTYVNAISIGIPFVLSFGGSFDMVERVTERATKWFQ